MSKQLAGHGKKLAVLVDKSVLKSVGIEASTPLKITTRGDEIVIRRAPRVPDAKSPASRTKPRPRKSEVAAAKPITRAEMLALPLAERRRLMRAEAAKLAPFYEADNEWREFAAGDIIEYEP